jgi:hypothetical protein
MKQQQALAVASLKMVHEIQTLYVSDISRPACVEDSRFYCRAAIATESYPLADKSLFSYKGTVRGDGLPPT